MSLIFDIENSDLDDLITLLLPGKAKIPCP
jgi:hypothetical protein